MLKQVAFAPWRRVISCPPPRETAAAPRRL